MELSERPEFVDHSSILLRDRLPTKRSVASQLHSELGFALTRMRLLEIMEKMLMVSLKTKHPYLAQDSATRDFGWITGKTHVRCERRFKNWNIS